MAAQDLSEYPDRYMWYFDILNALRCFSLEKYN